MRRFFQNGSVQASADNIEQVVDNGSQLLPSPASERATRALVCAAVGEPHTQ